MEDKIEELIQKLTLEEKAALLQGWSTWTTREIKHLGIPGLFLSDGPHGLRKQAGAGDHLGLNASVPATCFPTAATMANSWDVRLGEALGQALGEEAAANDVHVVLGPGLNIKRSPLCGRNFEYFSEDPYLAGKMAASYVRGIQSSGPAACPKHFAVNSQELRRMAMDSVVDERTLREIYLTGFEIAVKESGAKAIMSAYNEINGTYANENTHLLTDILRKEWGFDGFVVTDWGADNSHTEGVRAGCNLVMPAPGPDCALNLIRDVQAGKLEESVLDDRLRELLKVTFALRAAVDKAPKSFDREAHHALAQQCAAESIVLLDNDGILPLKTGIRVALIGEFAEKPRYQGAGSSQVNPTRVVNLKTALAEQGVTVTGYVDGFCGKSPKPLPERITAAAQLARASEAVLLCVGLDEITESEGLDRTNMELTPGQKDLIAAVSAANPNVVLVLSGGAPFVMPERSCYRAAIHGYLGGQAGAAAMAEALVGNVNPSGKLNETWPEKLEDNPSYPYFPSKERTAEYREGLFVGYRYYDTVGKQVRYPFGYGLSYTEFAYSELQADEKKVTFKLTNKGSRGGAEVAQVYISAKHSALIRPKKELKGFAKVYLEPGESKTVTVELDDKAFRYFDADANAWQVEAGEYEIQVAANVSDVRLQQSIQVEGVTPGKREIPECYRTGHIESVTEENFAALLGHEIPDGSWGSTIGVNDAFCQLNGVKSVPGNLVYKVLHSKLKKAEASGVPDLNIMFIYNMPFRATAKMAGGMVSEAMAEDLTTMLSGHFWKGTGRIIRDFFRNQRRSSQYLKKLEELEKK